MSAYRLLVFHLWVSIWKWCFSLNFHNAEIPFEACFGMEDTQWQKASTVFFLLKFIWRKAPLSAPPGCVLLKMRACIWCWPLEVHWPIGIFWICFCFSTLEQQSQISKRHELLLFILLFTHLLWLMLQIVIPACVEWVGRAVKQGPAASELPILCSWNCTQQVLGLCSGMSSLFSWHCNVHNGVTGMSYREVHKWWYRMLWAVGSSLLRAVPCWSCRRWEVGTTSPTNWTIFMDPWRQNFVKWSKKVFYFDWRHYYE